MLDRVQEQLTRRWERNQALVTHTRDRLAQYEAGLMDLREALNLARPYYPQLQNGQQ